MTRLLNSKYKTQYSTTLIKAHTATDFSRMYGILKLPNITIKFIGITNKEMLRVTVYEYLFQIFLCIINLQPITTKKGRTETSHYRPRFSPTTLLYLSVIQGPYFIQSIMWITSCQFFYSTELADSPSPSRLHRICRRELVQQIVVVKSVFSHKGLTTYIHTSFFPKIGILNTDPAMNDVAYSGQRNRPPHSFCLATNIGFVSVHK